MESSDSRPPGATEPIILQMPVVHHQSDDIVTRFANDLTVNMDDTGYFVAFYEIRAPFLGNSQEEVEKAARSLGSLRAECVCRLYIPKELMPRMQEAMHNSIEQRKQAEASRQQALGGDE